MTENLKKTISRIFTIFLYLGNYLAIVFLHGLLDTFKRYIDFTYRDLSWKDYFYPPVVKFLSIDTLVVNVFIALIGITYLGVYLWIEIKSEGSKKMKHIYAILSIQVVFIILTMFYLFFLMFSFVSLIP